MSETAAATIHADVEEILLTEEQIQTRVAELGAQLVKAYNISSVEHMTSCSVCHR